MWERLDETVAEIKRRREDDEFTLAQQQCMEHVSAGSTTADYRLRMMLFQCLYELPFTSTADEVAEELGLVYSHSVSGGPIYLPDPEDD